MRTTLIAAALCLVALASPDRADAWGFAAHRLIMARAIDQLPSELKPFFERYRSEILIRVVDPDMWRNVGWEDDPNHFVDFGATEYGAYPFAALPRDYNAALEKFGTAVLTRNGLLPWREAEMFGNLRRAFEEFRKSAPYTASNTMLFSAVAAHYIQDAHQPFHATINYDGQQTGQRGLHARFERDLIERYESRLRIEPGPLPSIVSIRDYAFDSLLASYQQVDAVLKADKDAIAGRTKYDDVYFDAFFAKVQPLLEQQLSRAVAATAGMIVAAWEQAGRPTVRLQDVRPVESVQAPR